MREISLNHGMVTMVDDIDYEWLCQFKWQVAIDRRKRTYYAVRGIKNISGGISTRPMHRDIMNTPKGLETDHKDGNGLNNQRENLRVCTPHQNRMNQRPFAHAASIYKGVTWRKDCQQWNARIWVNGKNLHLGLFLEEIKAAEAYNRAAQIHYREFARLNILKEAA